MVRSDTPTNALIANMTITFRLILKFMLSLELNFKKSKKEKCCKVIDI